MKAGLKDWCSVDCYGNCVLKGVRLWIPRAREDVIKN